MSIVSWQESARDELADIWVQATPEERAIIEGVILGTEKLLTEEADRVGESREGLLRFILRPPLSFWVRISSDGNEVRIVRVRRPNPPRKK